MQKTSGLCHATAAKSTDEALVEIEPNVQHSLHSTKHSPAGHRNINLGVRWGHIATYIHVVYTVVPFLQVPFQIPHWAALVQRLLASSTGGCETALAAQGRGWATEEFDESAAAL